MTLGAVIFDCDGVLVDSEPVHREALRAVLAPHGVRFDDDEYTERFIGLPDSAVGVMLWREHPTLTGIDPGALFAAKARLVAARLGAAPLQPGVEHLLAALGDLPLAVASGALRDELAIVLAQPALRARFAAVVGAEDVPRGKPDPAPFLEAHRRLAARIPGLAAAACVVIEDAPSGLAAAHRAGMRSVAVTTSHTAGALAGADLVVGSLRELDRDRLAALCV